MKYIMAINEYGDETPIIFPSSLIHKEVADGVIKECQCNHIISAGFVYVENNKFVTYGESESLNLKSNKNDADWINRYFELSNPNS